MNIGGFIRQKKAAFTARQEQRLAMKAHDAEVRQYKAEIEVAQRQKIEEAKAAKAEASELRSKQGVRGFVNRFSANVDEPRKKGGFAGVAKKAMKNNTGHPSIVGNPNSTVESGYRGIDTTYGGLQKKKKGYDPFGYRGLQ